MVLIHMLHHHIIAAALKKLDYDVIITGRQAIDGDTAQVGPQIAEHLGIPQVSYAEEVKAADDRLLLLRDSLKTDTTSSKLKLLALSQHLAELAKPRYMTVQRYR